MFGIVRVPGFISDNGSILIQRADTNYGASYASTVLQTSAPFLTAVYSASGGSSSQVFVIVDQELYDSFDVPADSASHSFLISLDGRFHTVELWDSGQINTGLTTLAATLREIQGEYTLLPTIMSDTRISVYGNSYSQGFDAGFVPPGGQAGIAGWWQLSRLDPAFPGRLSNIGSGGRALHTDFVIDPTMVTLAQWLTSQAAEVVSGNRKSIWYAGIELNDWDQNDWSAAAFGAALTTLVAAIIAIDSNVLIFLQSSFPAIGDAVPNTFGNTLQDYRNQVQAVAAANVNHSVFVDGTAANNGVSAITLADLTGPAPGHPSPAGHIHINKWYKATPALDYSFTVTLDGLLAWYRADQGVVPVAGHVSAWDSFGRSGDNNRNATQAIGGNRPVVPAAVAALNNQLGITFTAATAEVETTGVWSTPISFPCTMYIVGLTPVGLTAFYVDSLAADVPANRLVFYSSAGVPTMRAHAADIASVGVASSDPHVYCLVFDTTGQIFVDNMTTPNASGPLVAANPTGLNIGSDTSASFPVGGPLAEVLVYNSHHSENERQQVAAYLKLRYATP